MHLYPSSGGSEANLQLNLKTTPALSSLTPRCRSRTRASAVAKLAALAASGGHAKCGGARGDQLSNSAAALQSRLGPSMDPAASLLDRTTSLQHHLPGQSRHHST